jgi:hypothetical protein
MASRSSGVTLVPAGVCSLRDSSLQSHSNVPVPSSPRTPTIKPVTNSERGCVEVHQLLVSASMSGTSCGRKP